MTDGTNRETRRSSDSEVRRAAAPERAAVGAYEEGGDVVFYDTENPLAWIQAGETVRLEDAE